MSYYVVTFLEGLIATYSLGEWDNKGITDLKTVTTPDPWRPLHSTYPHSQSKLTWETRHKVRSSDLIVKCCRHHGMIWSVVIKCWLQVLTPILVFASEDYSTRSNNEEMTQTYFLYHIALFWLVAIGVSTIHQKLPRLSEYYTNMNAAKKSSPPHHNNHHNGNNSYCGLNLLKGKIYSLQILLRPNYHLRI